MAYNKAKEEKKWLQWKEAEEKKLRELGVSEETIIRLRSYDWEVFNSDRRYYRRKQESGTYLEEIAASEQSTAITSVDALLDAIENPALFRLLIAVDKLTLQIAVWKMDGFTSAEISEMCGLSESAINFRIWHLRQKMKKIF